MNELDRYSGIISNSYQITNMYKEYRFYRLRDANIFANKIKQKYGYVPEIFENKTKAGKTHNYTVVIPKNLKKV